MSDEQRIAALQWLYSHAKYGALPKHLDADVRGFLITLLSKEIGAITQKKKDVAIAQGKLEGEYIG